MAGYLPYLFIAGFACYGLFRYVKMMNLKSFRPQFIIATIATPLAIPSAYSIGIVNAYNRINKEKMDIMWQNIMFSNLVLVSVLTAIFGLLGVFCIIYCAENGIKKYRY